MTECDDDLESALIIRQSAELKVENVFQQLNMELMPQKEEKE
jgi:hypothetical protein